MSRKPNSNTKAVAARPAKHIEDQIRIVRGHRVLLDSDLARIYGVSTKRINEQVKRNRKRFPQGFVFQLTIVEAKASFLQGRKLRP
jgi:hypothetical protein